MSTVAVVPYLVHYDTLLQNATGIITKCDSFITTTRQLLQNATFVTKCVGVNHQLSGHLLTQSQQKKH